MRNHYAIIEIDPEGRVGSVKLRMGELTYPCEVHDQGSGERTLKVMIDTPRLIGGAPQESRVGRSLELAAAEVRLHAMYGKFNKLEKARR